MEEVDNIIIHSLRQIGCDVDEEIKRLEQFPTEFVIEATVRCLEVIMPGLGLPRSLPPNLSAKFGLASSIAQICQDIGYTGDVGFQTFLYSNDADIRKIFMFLIERLPKEAEKSSLEPEGRAIFLLKEIREMLKIQLSSLWVSSYCLTLGLRWTDDKIYSREGVGQSQPYMMENFLISAAGCNSSRNISMAWQELYAKYLPSVAVNGLPVRRKLLPTMLSLNSLSLLLDDCQPNLSTDKMKTKNWLAECIVNEVTLWPDIKHDGMESISEYNLVKTLKLNNIGNIDDKVKPKIAPKPKGAAIDPDVLKKRNATENVDKLKEEIENLRQDFDGLQVNMKTTVAKLMQVIEEISIEEKILNDKQESYAVKKRTYNLLPEADANASKLEATVEASAQRLVSLAAQWEQHRSPLLIEYRLAKLSKSNKASKSQRQVDAVRSLREKVKEMTEELKNKDQHHQQLLIEYEKIPKDINRSAYTLRILEIIGNIRKQKEEIDKVLKDTKDLQKEINNISGQLDRSFTVADELIFKDAKKDETSRRAYKLLAMLHSDCSELVQMVQDTGATVREIRDFEEQIEMETMKNGSANLERISADLKQMKQESAVLSAQMKLKS